MLRYDWNGDFSMNGPFVLAKDAEEEIAKASALTIARTPTRLEVSRDLTMMPAREVMAAIAGAVADARNAALEAAAKVCDAQAEETECPERAAYCAEAIRALKTAAE